MSVKQKMLEVLENNRGEYISGGQLAKILDVSRNAIWKAVKSLENEGYAIDAVKNRGYRLAKTNDLLSEQSIRKYLTDSQNRYQITVKKRVSSTNEELKQAAFAGAREGEVLITEEQTCGKAHRGREFYSPKGNGIYMSILLRPKASMEQAFLLPAAAAVAVAQAIDSVSGNHSQIKWVNDILVDGKKVCGILTEASFDLETRGLHYVVLGIGIHVKGSMEAFPKVNHGISGAVFEQSETAVRSQLIAEVLMRFADFYQELDKKTFFEEYRNRSCLLGKTVYLEKKEERVKGKVLDITERCHLLVEMEDGEVEELSAGTVSMEEEL